MFLNLRIEVQVHVDIHIHLGKTAVVAELMVWRGQRLDVNDECVVAQKGERRISIDQ
jgi:hypothetical protein